jgi:hypothetical protein
MHRKELHDLLVGAGIDPAITRWTNDTKSWCRPPAETLEVGLCHFLICPDSDGLMSVHIKPGARGALQEGLVNQNWNETTMLFRQWARVVAEEIKHEDPWSKYAAYFPQVKIGEALDNSPYTHAEAEHAAEAVKVFLSHIKAEVPGYEGVADSFDSQFERLADQAKKGAGRIDWSNQFMGMLISLCVTLSLSPETASGLWKSWMQIIDGLLLK